MKFTYLLINFFTILIPFIYSFDKRIRFYKKWKAFAVANLLTSIFFLVWDYFKTKNGVWGFNDEFIIGVKFFGLPLEEYLFFLTVPYACVFIYESVSLLIKNVLIADGWQLIFYSISFISFFTSFLFLDKIYTCSVLFFLGLILPIAVHELSKEKFDKLLITFFISLIPMFLVNGLLTGLPVVVYNNTENLSIRVGTIPVEDFVYNAILLSMTITLFEWQKRKATLSDRDTNASPHSAL